MKCTSLKEASVTAKTQTKQTSIIDYGVPVGASFIKPQSEVEVSSFILYVKHFIYVLHFSVCSKYCNWTKIR